MLTIHASFIYSSILNFYIKNSKLSSHKNFERKCRFYQCSWQLLLWFCRPPSYSPIVSPTYGSSLSFRKDVPPLIGTTYHQRQACLIKVKTYLSMNPY